MLTSTQMDCTIHMLYLQMDYRKYPYYMPLAIVSFVRK